MLGPLLSESRGRWAVTQQTQMLVTVRWMRQSLGDTRSCARQPSPVAANVSRHPT